MSIKTPFFSSDNSRQDSECVIFVEGNDDVFFLSKLLEELSADSKAVGIVQVGGKDNFEKNLKSFFKSPGFTQGKTKSISVVCDADDDPHTIAKKINKVLKNSNQPEVLLGEHVTNSDGIKYGLFTMPDCNTSGDLEKLCLSTVSGEPIEKEADSFIQKMEKLAKDANKSLNGSRFKRKAQVFLAGVPGDVARGIGRGYANKIFNTDSSVLNPLKDFLKESIS